MIKNAFTMCLLALVCFTNFITPYGKNVCDTKHLKKEIVTIHLFFLSDFDDVFRIYVNGKLVKQDHFKTDPSTSSCLNYLDVAVNRNVKNVIQIKDIHNIELYSFYLQTSIKKYVYIERLYKVWSHRNLKEPLDIE